MHTLPRFIVEKLSQYQVGCWNIHCAGTHEVYFKLVGFLFYFIYLFILPNSSCKANQLVKRTFFVLFMVQMLFTAILPTTAMKTC